MNLIELGGLLKREREKRGLTLRDVMEATKISRRNLNALEDGDAGLLPHPVYLKGYVRNYAHMVGLDAEPLVAVVEQQSDGDSGYLPQTPPAPGAAPVSAPVSEAVSAPVGASGAAQTAEPAAVDPADPAEPAAEPGTETAATPAKAEPAPEPEKHTPTFMPIPDPEPQPEPQTEPKPEPKPAESFESQIRYSRSEISSSRPRRIWPWLLVLLFAAIMVGLYLQYRRIQAEVDQAPIAAPLPAENATNATNATDDLNATALDANATALEANASLPAPEAAPAAPAAPQQDKDTPAAKPLPPQTPAPAVSGSPVDVRKGQNGAQPAAEARTPGMQQLVITAKPNEACWVEVSEGGQRKSFTLKNGDSRRFEFSQKAKVRLGNAGGVTFQLNGSPYPFEGERGATATVEIGAH